MISSARRQHDELGLRVEFSGKTILSGNEIDLLGVTIDTNSHITKICCKASRQLNALKRLCFYIPLDTLKILANSFIISNFNYILSTSLVFFNGKAISENRENTGKGSQISAR